MNKLTIKELAPYLPYGLKVQWIREDDNEVITSVLTISDYPFLITRNRAKPILRPLSDLTNLIPKNNVSYIAYLWHEVISTDSDSFDKDKFFEDCCLGSIEYLPIMVLPNLLEWHFDIFGLLEKKLAIDINTLKNEN